MKYFIILLGSFFTLVSWAQQPWEIASYPDELGWIRRSAGAIDRIAEKEYGVRSLALSICPDTGLPVYLWAVEGEEIISPYTGRKYIQGPTGYFGPKARNAEGEIISFGGDPLKYDLDPVTARMMKNPDDVKARGFLSIWGNMIQQYHFGACNWARFYGLCASDMGAAWQAKFQKAVGEYEERRRPSDGAREHDPLPRPYNLVGFTDEKEGVLGGGFTNGGTENHKTMWRSSALVYAGLFPEKSLISGFTPEQVKEIVPGMLRDFFRKILQVGNGEYDSHIYYPHSIYGFLNLYDFAANPEYREFAKFIIDYYLITYGLKCVDNTIAGAQKRGYLSNITPSEMEIMMWAWSGIGSKDMTGKEIHLHQATASYRPNRVIFNILANNIRFPFEAKISRPTYHMNIRNAFQESFFRSSSYALGNVVMTMVDNPNQQVVWSLVAEGKNGPLCFGGQQPYRMGPHGHSQYTQTMHSKRSLILMTAQTALKPDRQLSEEEQSRYREADVKLKPLAYPAQPAIGNVKQYFLQAKESAVSWLYIPKSIDRVIEQNGCYFIEANTTFVAVMPLGKAQWISSSQLPSGVDLKEIHEHLAQYDILSVSGDVSGYMIDSAEKSTYATLENFAKATLAKKRVVYSPKNLTVEYTSLEGEILKMKYMDTGLRARAWIDGEAVDYDNWADGYVYNSPYVKTKDGIMCVTDGKEGYKIDFTGNSPVYSIWNP